MPFTTGKHVPRSFSRVFRSIADQSMSQWMTAVMLWIPRSQTCAPEIAKLPGIGTGTFLSLGRLSHNSMTGRQDSHDGTRRSQ